MNRYGRPSKLCITTQNIDGTTRLQDVSFTAPFKILSPFYHQDWMQLMQLSVSAGIMAGDEAFLAIQVGEQCKLELLSQSFEKIHRMDEGFAIRHTEIEVAEQGFLHYHPMPTIPFADSDFRGSTDIHLVDQSAKLCLEEVLSCGRSGCGERFQYRRYQMKTRVFCGGNLIYYDATNYQPDCIDMNGIGMYEGYSHLLNLLFCNVETDEASLVALQQHLLEAEGYTGGASRLHSGDVVVRVFGDSAELLQTQAYLIREKLYPKIFCQKSIIG